MFGDDVDGSVGKCLRRCCIRRACTGAVLVESCVISGCVRRRSAGNSQLAAVVLVRGCVAGAGRSLLVSRAKRFLERNASESTFFFGN